MFVIAVKFGKAVRYIHEIYLGKHAKSNKGCYFVRYNRVFVITVIVITEFDYMSNLQWPRIMMDMHKLCVNKFERYVKVVGLKFY